MFSITLWCHNRIIHHVPNQLPHSYYFTTPILVLKKFEEIQDSHFPRKGGILVLASVNLEKKGLILMSSIYCENGGSFGLKSQCFTAKKGVNFELKSQCFIAKKGSFWAEKSVFCCKKGGHFQTGEQGWVPVFPVSEGAGVPYFHNRSFCTLIRPLADIAWCHSQVYTLIMCPSTRVQGYMKCDIFYAD